MPISVRDWWGSDAGDGDGELSLNRRLYNWASVEVFEVAIFGDTKCQLFKEKFLPPAHASSRRKSADKLT